MISKEAKRKKEEQDTKEMELQKEMAFMRDEKLCPHCASSKIKVTIKKSFSLFGPSDEITIYYCKGCNLKREEESRKTSYY